MPARIEAASNLGRVPFEHGFVKVSDPSATPPELFCDPVLQHVMIDPVMCSDGYTYDRSTLSNPAMNISPFTRKPSSIWGPNVALRSAIFAAHPETYAQWQARQPVSTAPPPMDAAVADVEGIEAIGDREDRKAILEAQAFARMEPNDAIAAYGEIVAGANSPEARALARMRLGRLYLSDADYGGAFFHFNKAVHDFGPTAERLALRGVANVLRRRPADARRDLQEAQSLSAQDNADLRRLRDLLG